MRHKEVLLDKEADAWQVVTQLLAAVLLAS